MHDAPDTTSLKILIADDNEEVLALLTLLLRGRGYAVEGACDGRAAVELAGALRPNVVILDIDMPHLNGYEAAKQIRQHLGSSVVLIALTGRGSDSDKQAATQAGFDHHFKKPPDVEALNKLLAGLAARQTRHE